MTERNRGLNPNTYSSQRENLSPREALVERWKNAPFKIHKYPAGKITGSSGETLYEYSQGARLLMGDETKEEVIEVMDSCDTPWAFATVDMAFKELGAKDRPVKVLERGFGMGITARRVIQNLVAHGGEYTVIELNEENAAYARQWRTSQEYSLTRMTHGLQDSRPNISIEVLDGEATEVTGMLQKAERKFDIIISDTFPLSEEERGMNDLLDLDILKHCLESGGVFTFFAYYPESNGGIKELQMSAIRKHFSEYREDEVEVNPPPDYTYLQSSKGPIRKLPVAVCKNPKI